MKQSSLTFEQFVSEAEQRLEKETLRGAIIFVEKAQWENLDLYIKRFNEKREEKLEVINTPQKDFLVFRFYNVKNNKEEPREHFFFIKVYQDKDYYSLISFGFCDHSIFNDTIRKFILSSNGFWFAWIGSKFLEDFEGYLKMLMPVQDFKIKEYNLEYRNIHGKRSVGSSKRWKAQNKDEIRNIRLAHREFGELVYVKKAKYELKSSDSRWIVALSDRSEFSVKNTKLSTFISLLRSILAISKTIRNELNKKLEIKNIRLKKQNSIENSISIQGIESLDLIVSNPIYENWFENLTQAFSLGYLSEYKLVASVKETGNPYFLVELIDIQNGSVVFLSVIGKTISIVPSENETKPSTVSKVLSVLQQRVDPSIGVGEDIGKIRFA